MFLENMRLNLSLPSINPVKIIELHEREARIFPRSELYDVLGQSLLLPETRALSAIDLRDVAAGVELRVLGVIGYLPLTKTLILHLTPKFPLKNLWAMLEIADEKYERILPVLRSYESSNTTAPHQLLAKSFCHYLRDILTTGVARGYYQVAVKGYYKPKVNFGRTVSTFLSRGDEVNVASDAFTFSTNLYPNGLLKSACLSFLKIIPISKKWESERRLLASALNALDMASPRVMKPGDQELSTTLPMWLREGYYGALTVYSVLLGFTKVGFSYNSSGSTMPSFLFSMDFIFESYVRNYIRNSLAEQRIAVLDGNSGKNQRPLFIDNKRFPIKPDLIFRKDKTTIALGEVKYKPRIEESDRYQVISHVVASNSPIGIWISPSTNGDAGLEYIGAIATGAKFYHYKLDITGDMASSSSAMLGEILSII